MTAATVVGFLIVTVISSFLSMVIFAAFIASASTSKPVKVQEGSLMKINLSGAVVLHDFHIGQLGQGLMLGGAVVMDLIKEESKS